MDASIRSKLPGLNSGYQTLRDDNPSTQHGGGDFHDSTRSGLSARRSISGARHTGASGWSGTRGGPATGYGGSGRDSGAGLGSQPRTRT